MPRLVVGTTNTGKMIEIRSALGELRGWTLEPIAANVPPIEEIGESFVDNAVQKAEHYSKFVPDLTLGDDSGLCVDALGGRPGVHSARYAGNPAARIRRLLGEMRPVPDDRRQAVFYCALALAQSGKIVWTVQAEVSGVIAHTPSGTGGFGYDPVFLLPERGRTMAELSTEEQNRLSARGKALAELQNFLLSSSSLSSVL
jgi:XTP/dITP diphosphohydrolase